MKKKVQANLSKKVCIHNKVNHTNLDPGIYCPQNVYYVEILGATHAYRGN